MTTPTLRTLSAVTHPCDCVQRHTPSVHRTHSHHVWPLGWGGPDTAANQLPVCPTTHGEVHLILEKWRRAGRRLGRGRAEAAYAYELARRGWDAATAAGWQP